MKAAQEKILKTGRQLYLAQGLVGEKARLYREDAEALKSLEKLEIIPRGGDNNAVLLASSRATIEETRSQIRLLDSVNPQCIDEHGSYLSGKAAETLSRN